MFHPVLRSHWLELCPMVWLCLAAREDRKYNILFWEALCLAKVLGSFIKEKKENGYWIVNQQSLLQWYLAIVAYLGLMTPYDSTPVSSRFGNKLVFLCGIKLELYTSLLYLSWKEVSF